MLLLFFEYVLDRIHYNFFKMHLTLRLRGRGGGLLPLFRKKKSKSMGLANFSIKNFSVLKHGMNEVVTSRCIHDFLITFTNNF